MEPVGSWLRQGPAAAPADPSSPSGAASAGGWPPASSSGGSTPESSHLGSMFQLSPEGQLPPGLAVAAAALEAADSEAGDSQAGGDLSAFLADLKSKYGLAGGPHAASNRSNMDCLIAAEPPAVSVHVMVQSQAHGDTAVSCQPRPPALPRSPPRLSSPGQFQRALTLPAAAHQSWAATSTGLLLPVSKSATVNANPMFGDSHTWGGTDGEGGTGEQQEDMEQQQAQPGSWHQQEQQAQAGGWQQQEQEEQPGSWQQQEQVEQERDDLDADLDAELSTLEDLQRQLSKPQQQVQAKEAQRKEARHAAASSSGSDAAGLTGGPAAAAAAAAADMAPPPPPVLRQQLQQQRQLPWGSLHNLLVRHGFPGLLPVDTADAPVPADTADLQEQQQPQQQQQALEPEPAAVFETLHSLLQEHQRGSLHQQRLAEAAQATARREAALIAGFTSAARQREAEVTKWKRLALDTQKAARDAQLSSQHSSHVEQQLAAEARQLERRVSQLQHALHSRVGANGSWAACLRSQPTTPPPCTCRAQDAFPPLLHPTFKPVCLADFTNSPRCRTWRWSAFGECCQPSRSGRSGGSGPTARLLPA